MSPSSLEPENQAAETQANQDLTKQEGEAVPETDLASPSPLESSSKPTAPESKKSLRDRVAAPNKRGARFWILLSIFLALNLAILVFGLYASWMPGRSHSGPLPPLDEAGLQISKNLEAHLMALAGPKVPARFHGSPAGYREAQQFLTSQMRAYGWELKSQAYRSISSEALNLVAERPGKIRPEEIVVIGAHYDAAAGRPGANDNASGCAAVLELARLLGPEPRDKTLRLVFFADEEPPYFQGAFMGSLRYAEGCKERAEKIIAMFSLETIGYYSEAPGSQQYPSPLGQFYPSAGNFIAFVANPRSRPLLLQTIRIFRESEPFPSEGACLPSELPGVGWSDHWSFWQAGYPALMITDTAPFRYPHYHTFQDTPDKLDYDRMARVVRGLAPVIAALTRSES